MTISSPTESSDVREVLASVRRSRMNRFQASTVALALALIVMDGFEVAMMAFSAPQIQAEMNVSPDLLGYVLSSTLLGMALGSMFLAPIADRVGRRPVTLAALLLILVGMLLAMTAPTAAVLIVWRVLTGLGRVAKPIAESLRGRAQRGSSGQSYPFVQRSRATA